MRRLFVAAAAAALIVTFTACLPASFATGAPPGEVYAQRNFFFINGWIGHAVVDAGAMCPRGVSAVVNESGIVDVVISLVTAFLVTPRTVIVVCAGGAAANDAGPEKVVVGHDERGRRLYVAKQDKDGSVEVVSQTKGGGK